MLCITGFEQDPLDKLIGNWKLEKVETNGKTILPTNHYTRFKDYSLAISATAVSYNFDINVCDRTITSIDDNKIKLSEIYRGSSFCYNGRFDSIVHYIDYTGTYEVHDSLLIITNNKGKHYLIRQ